MLNIISLIFMLVIIHLMSNTIKKHNLLTYALCTVISVTAIYASEFSLSNLITGGFFGLSLWIIIMFVGVRNPFKNISKKVRLIRAELSIIAFIFTFAHFIHDFMLNLESPILAGLISLIIMVPLFITSFETIRKHMNNKSWKKLHGFAYLAYIIMLLHVIFITNELPHIIYYSIVLIAYLLLKFKSNRGV